MEDPSSCMLSQPPPGRRNDRLEAAAASTRPRPRQPTLLADRRRGAGGRAATRRRRLARLAVAAAVAVPAALLSTYLASARGAAAAAAAAAGAGRRGKSDPQPLQPPPHLPPGLTAGADGAVWLQYYAEYQRGSGSKRRRGRGGGAGGADEQGDLYEDHGVPDDDDDDDPGASPLSSADPLLYRVPAAIAALPDDGSVRIQEAMNSLLEETLDDVDRLLLELERLGEGGGVDLESDEFFAAAEYGEDEGDDEDFDDEDFDGSGGFGSDDDYGEGGEEGGGSERGPAAAPRRSGTAKPKARPYEAWADGVEFAAYDYGGGGGADADGEDAGEQGAGAGAREGLVGPAAAMWAVDPGELGALEAVLGEVGAPPDLRSEWRWLDAGHHYCSWGGVYCGPAPPRRGRGGGGVVGPAPPRASTDEDAAEAEAAAEVVVIRIELPRAGLSGSVPRSAARLKHLQVLNLANNRLGGTLPAAELANLTRASLRVLDLSHNRLSGTVPLSQLLGAGGSSHGGEELPEAGGSASVLEELRLSFNHFTGSLAPLEAAAEPALSAAAIASGSRSVKGGASPPPPPPNATSTPDRASPLRWLDLSANDLTGPLPGALLSGLSDLEVLLLGDNFFADDGAPFPDLRNLSSLEAVDVGHNLLGGPAGSLVSGLPDGVEQVNAGRNLFNGTLPADLWRLSGLQVLLLSDNQMTGPLPTAAAAADDDSYGALRDLRVWWMARNGLQGPLPRDLFVGLQSSLEMLDVSYNSFNSTIPTEIGLLTNLYHVDAMGNQLRGSLPDEMLNMNRNLRLNFTDNLLTGTIPAMFCGEGLASSSMLYQEFGCDAVLCRPGTFSPYGHATLHSACRPCPTGDDGDSDSVNSRTANGTNSSVPPLSKILGRTSCDGVEFVHGDLDGDGELSPREILRMLYIDNLGRFWGPDYQTWADMSVSECKLTGVVCLMGFIVKVDLGSASLCSDGDRKPAPIMFCKGLPREIGQLSTLEFLHLTRQKFLRGTLPTEIGQLTRLQVLDLTSCASVVSTLPTELGRLANLHTLKISHTQLYGPIPSELFTLPLLEILHLTNNRFSGKLPPMRLPSIRELMLARNDLSGTLPNDLSSLARLENFEAYHNRLSGTLPSRIGDCEMLKRIDLFSNKLSGELPASLVRMDSLQILHLKDNLLTGTIPELGRNPLLSWVDLSDNYLHGPIPPSFGTSRVIEDLRLGHNMIHDPIPPGLCSNTRLNGGATTTTSSTPSSQQQHENSGGSSSKAGSHAKDPQAASSSSSSSCDHVLCPLGTYSDSGHASESSPCHKCPPGQTTLYLGSPRSSCHVVTPERLLSILFEVMRGEAWPLPFQENWGDESVPVCQWAGLTCDENDELTALAYPLRGSDDY